TQSPVWRRSQWCTRCSLGYLGSTEETGPRETKDLWEPAVKWDLKVLKGPKEPRVPRPFSETVNNARGKSQ
ncbi:hypothetical protein OS493_027450, partial [Desmophyllum pertusum]